VQRRIPIAERGAERGGGSAYEALRAFRRAHQHRSLKAERVHVTLGVRHAAFGQSLGEQRAQRDGGLGP
jgi:hypothetical protein